MFIDDGGDDDGYIMQGWKESIEKKKRKSVLIPLNGLTASPATIPKVFQRGGSELFDFRALPTGHIQYGCISSWTSKNNTPDSCLHVPFIISVYLFFFQNIKMVYTVRMIYNCFIVTAYNASKIDVTQTNFISFKDWCITYVSTMSDGTILHCKLVEDHSKALCR